MPLATLNDLLMSPTDEVEGLIKKATGLCDVYETYLAEDGGGARLQHLDEAGPLQPCRGCRVGRAARRGAATRLSPRYRTCRGYSQSRRLKMR